MVPNGTAPGAERQGRPAIAAAGLGAAAWLILAGRGVAWSESWVLLPPLLAVLAARLGGGASRPAPRSALWWLACLGWLTLAVAWSPQPRLGLRTAAECWYFAALGWAGLGLPAAAARRAIGVGASAALVGLSAFWVLNALAARTSPDRAPGLAIGPTALAHAATVAWFAALSGPPALAAASSLLGGLLVGNIAARTGWLALTASAGLLASHSGRRRLAALALLGAALGVGRFATDPHREVRLAKVTTLHGRALTSGRTIIWRNAAAVWGSAPVLGVGTGGFGPRYAEVRRAALAAGGPPSQPTVSAHNVVLHVGAEQGAIGVLLLLGALGASAREALRDRDHHAGAGWLLVAILGISEAVTAYPGWKLLVVLLLVGRDGPARGEDPRGEDRP